MRPLKTLTFAAFRDLLATTFAEIADQRDPRRITWEMPAVLMSAFAMLFFQHPSLLEYQRRMQKRTGRSNLERVFQVEEIPSDTQMREILDGVPHRALATRVAPDLRTDAAGGLDDTVCDGGRGAEVLPDSIRWE